MNLQSLINSQSGDPVLELPPGEFFGQVVIDRAITIVGQGKATWIGSRTSPTIQITVPGVILKDVMVEVTAGREFIAIEAWPQTAPILEDVTVKGTVIGVPAENIREGESVEHETSPNITFVPPPPISLGDRPDSSTSSQPTFFANEIRPHPSSLGVLPRTLVTPPLNPQTSRTASQWFSASTPRHFWYIGIIVALVVALVSAVFSISMFLQNRGTGTAESDTIEKYKQEGEHMAIRLKAVEKEKSELEHRERERADRENREKREKEEAQARIRELRREKDQATAKVRELEQQRDQALAKAMEAQRHVYQPSYETNIAKLQRDETEANSAQSFDNLLQMAQLGNAAAQYWVGMNHYQGATFHWAGKHSLMGKPFPKDDKLAAEWLRRAAKQGHRDAQVQLTRLRKP